MSDEPEIRKRSRREAFRPMPEQAPQQEPQQGPQQGPQQQHRGGPQQQAPKLPSPGFGPRGPFPRPLLNMPFPGPMPGPIMIPILVPAHMVPMHMRMPYPQRPPAHMMPAHMIPAHMMPMPMRMPYPQRPWAGPPRAPCPHPPPHFQHQPPHLQPRFNAPKHHESFRPVPPPPRPWPSNPASNKSTGSKSAAAAEQASQPGRGINPAQASAAAAAAHNAIAGGAVNASRAAAANPSDAEPRMRRLPTAGIGKAAGARLPVDVMMQLLAHLQGYNTTLAAMRATCTEWRLAVDLSIQDGVLSPSALLPKDLMRLYGKLKHLRLVSCRNVRNRDLFALANAPPAEKLHLTALALGDNTNKPWLTNRGVESIVRLTELKFLALHDCNSITNKGILLLSQLTRLDTLSLRGCRKLTDTGFDFINALTRVTKLNLYGCKRLTVQGLAKLVPLPLVALSLGQTRIRPDALDTLTRMRGLTELHLVREYMGTAIVKLTALNALEVLSLRSTELTNASATELLRALPALKDFCAFRNDTIGRELINAVSLQAMDKLTALDLRGTEVRNVELSSLTVLTNLENLKLGPSQTMCYGSRGLLFDGYPCVQFFSQLTSLAMCGVPCYSELVMASVGVLTGLKELDLSKGTLKFSAEIEGRLLPDCVYAEVAKLTQLTFLDLSGCKLEGPKLEGLLKQLPLLRRIYIVCATKEDSQTINHVCRNIAHKHVQIIIETSKSKADCTTEYDTFGLAGTLSLL